MFPPRYIRYGSEAGRASGVCCPVGCRHPSSLKAERAGRASPLLTLTKHAPSACAKFGSVSITTDGKRALHAADDPNFKPCQQAVNGGISLVSTPDPSGKSTFSSRLLRIKATGCSVGDNCRNDLPARRFYNARSTFVVRSLRAMDTPHRSVGFGFFGSYNRMDPIAVALLTFALALIGHIAGQVHAKNGCRIKLRQRLPVGRKLGKPPPVPGFISLVAAPY